MIYTATPTLNPLWTAVIVQLYKAPEAEVDLTRADVQAIMDEQVKSGRLVLHDTTPIGDLLEERRSDGIWMRQESFGEIQAWVIRGLVARMTQNTENHSETATQDNFLHLGLESMMEASDSMDLNKWAN